MIGLDTNVIVRAIVDDPAEPGQCAAAGRVFRALSPTDPGFISLVTLVEVCWVLRASFGFSRADVAGAVMALASRVDLVFEQYDRVYAAAHQAARLNRDIPDAIIAAAGAAAGCSRTVTFDHRAADLPGMELLDADLS